MNPFPDYDSLVEAILQAQANRNARRFNALIRHHWRTYGKSFVTGCN